MIPKSLTLYDYDCQICGKYIGSNCSDNHSVVYKLTKEKIVVCETCLSFITYHGEHSTFEVIK